MSERIIRIRQLIEESGKTYQELEEMTGIKKSSLQRYVSGATEKIPLSAIESLANTFNISPVYLMGWDDLDNQVDLEKFKNEIANEDTTEEMIIAQYGKDVWEALCLYIKLDAEDRAEIRGMMKGLFRSEKYSTEEGLKNA